MKKNLIIILLFSFMPGYLFAQTDCDVILKKAYLNLNNNNIDEAYKQLKYLDICDDKNYLKKERNDLQVKIFERINQQKNTADLNARSAMAANAVAQSEKAKAENALIKARQSDSLAQNAKRQAELEKENSQNNTYKNAPSEYARLIREGPTDKKGIQKDIFDYKLTAYTEHLDKLGPLIEKTNDNVAIKNYNNLIDRLYYNNDLYEKIYSCLVSIDPNAKKKLFTSDPSMVDFKFSNDLDVKSPAFEKISGDLQAAGKKVIKCIKNRKDLQIICATDDNWIYVYSNNNTPVLENSISMGARVTALYYNEEKSIIYFGLESGNIGFIPYNKDKKNQPVFENGLGTPVIALQMFKTTIKGNPKVFLLAAGKKSKVVVYELDENTLVPDKRLLGNILPEKNLGDLSNAQFDEQSKLIIISGQSAKSKTQTIYLWNPFTALALDVYKKFRNDAIYLSSTKIY
jgi:hypothetical protein